jgi:nucleoside-diphosphate-sugar epimerase
VIDGPVLLTGAAGFVGRHVLARFQSEAEAPRLRLMEHRRALVPEVANRTEVVRADLADSGSLEGMCTGITTLVHVASHIGDEPARCEAVNAQGTEALVAQARRAGVQRIVYMSNAAVYGYAVHRGATEAEAVVAPATPISRSRASAERSVLGAGGIVLRPLFVYGNGDTRFLPAVARSLVQLPFLIEDGRARLSVVAVDDLADVVYRLATAETTPVEGGAYHVTDGHPLTFRSIAETIAVSLNLRVPRWSVPYGIGRWLVRMARGGLLGEPRWTVSDDHRLFLATHDHVYDDAKLRKVIAFPRRLSLPERLPGHAEWYASFARSGI